MLYKRFLENKFVLRGFATQQQVVKTNKKRWKSVVGLEVHAQIASESKLFSGSSTAFGIPLNNAVSYFDASIPGTLPVLNRKCVELGVKTALALGCCINEVSMFDRKHYFYADLPAGYQITQQRAALANNGELMFPVITPGKDIYYKTSRLLQLQLEQDSGKSLHDDLQKRSLVDLNRAGIPLMELVFAPDLESGEEAASLIKELILILRRLRSCSCRMEEGALRVDANISVHEDGEPYGVRTEVKNIGSVRSISQAISFEINRQLELVMQGGIVTNETRAWDALARRTVSMRDKEVLQDYRFMPEPNLPPLRLRVKELDSTNSEMGKKETLVSVIQISNELPELPEDTRKHLLEKYKLSLKTAIILVNEPMLLQYFLDIMQHLPGIPTKMVTNFLINDLLTFCNKINVDIEQCKLTYTHLKDILKSIHADEINLQAGRQLIELLHNQTESSISTLIEQHKLQQISDDATIEQLCRNAIAKQANAVKQYQNGKQKALFAILGEVAKASQQTANMKSVVKCLEKMLKSK